MTEERQGKILFRLWIDLIFKMVGVHGSVPHQTSERGDVCVAFFIHLFKFFLLFKAYQITEQNHEKNYLFAKVEGWLNTLPEKKTEVAYKWGRIALGRGR